LQILSHIRFTLAAIQWKRNRLLLGIPLLGKNEGSVKLNRDQLRWVVGLLTGHLKGYLSKLGLDSDPICERCLEEDESATNILCDCEAEAHVIFRHLGQFFMEPNDYYDAPIDKVLHFIRGVGLIGVTQKGKHNRSLKVAVQGLVFVLTPYTYIPLLGTECRTTLKFIRAVEPISTRFGPLVLVTLFS
jgi:hypothetical protein